MNNVYDNSYQHITCIYMYVLKLDNVNSLCICSQDDYINYGFDKQLILWYYILNNYHPSCKIVLQVVKSYNSIS